MMMQRQTIATHRQEAVQKRLLEISLVCAQEDFINCVLNATYSFDDLGLVQVVCKKIFLTSIEKFNHIEPSLSVDQNWMLSYISLSHYLRARAAVKSPGWNH